MTPNEKQAARAERYALGPVLFEKSAAERTLRQALRACTLAMQSARLDGFPDAFWTEALATAERLLS